jgi:CheY-like chemotaxis protein
MTPSAEASQVTDTSDSQKTILLAEDDRATQNLLIASLHKLSDYQVIAVDNGAEALDVLKKQTVNVIVTDLHMPIMDGFELISIIYDRYPQIPVLVMTGLAEISHQNIPLFQGSLRILSKPIKLSTLIEQVKKAAEHKPSDTILEIRLNALLQLMEWEQTSCTLTVQAEQDMGILYFQTGELIHASFKELEGLEAAYKILNWACPRIEFANAQRIFRTITIPLCEVILNAPKFRK